jgi:hypothetical protein
MASTFRMDTKSSLVTDAVSNPTTNVLTAASTSTLVLLSVMVANKSSNSANVDVYLVTTTGDDIYLIRNAPVPAGSSLELISGSKVIVESSDVLRARADTSSALDISISYLDQTP